MTFDKPYSNSMKLTDDVEKFVPKYSDIPEEFKNMSNNKWVKWQQNWFFNGLKPSEIPKAKPGIDVNDIMRHLHFIQRSWAIKHEHKEAGVAYLASLWFEDTEVVKQ